MNAWVDDKTDRHARPDGPGVRNIDAYVAELVLSLSQKTVMMSVVSSRASVAGLPRLVILEKMETQMVQTPKCLMLRTLTMSESGASRGLST